MKPLLRALRAHPLAWYFVLAYAGSWIIGVPLALSAHGRFPAHLPLQLHYLTAFGPAVAALLLTAATEGRAGLRGLVDRLTRVRGLWVWHLVSFGSPILLFALAWALVVASGHPASPWSDLGTVNFLPYLGAGAWALWFLTSGLGEEIGWRGFTLPRMQARRSALLASLWLGLLWAGWHIPAFFYLPNYAAMGLKIFPLFAFGVVTGAVLLTWLYNSTGGSILAAVLWHASFNFVTASAAGAGTVAALTSNAVIVWALIILWRRGAATLSRAPKQTAPARAEPTATGGPATP